MSVFLFCRTFAEGAELKKTIFKGVGTALITPFKEDFSVDYEAFKKLCVFQLDSGVNALIVGGTTGEGVTLKTKEKQKLLSIAVEMAQGRAAVIAGTGANDTQKAVSATKDALKAGADAALVVTPYYNKTSQTGLIEYYKRIADVGLSIIAYHVPSRTGMRIKPETMKKIAEIKNVCGLKEADILNAETVERIGVVRECGAALYSGSDELNLPFFSLGAAGVISVLSNILPKEVLRVYSLFTDGNLEECIKAQMRLNGLIGALFIDVNPIPIKYAMALAGACENVLRSPLVTLDEDKKEILRREWEKIV